MAKSFSYHTRIGTFYIRPKKDNPSYFALYINEDFLNSYEKLEDAVEAVSLQNSGYKEWDSLEYGGRIDLSQWTEI